MDFVFDGLASGRRIKTLTVVGDSARRRSASCRSLSSLD
jgi:hypothetical protein